LVIACSCSHCSCPTAMVLMRGYKLISGAVIQHSSDKKEDRMASACVRRRMCLVGGGVWAATWTAEGSPAPGVMMAARQNWVRGSHATYCPHSICFDNWENGIKIVVGRNPPGSVRKSATFLLGRGTRYCVQRVDMFTLPLMNGPTVMAWRLAANSLRMCPAVGTVIRAVRLKDLSASSTR
jgi:hypothetical protein